MYPIYVLCAYMNKYSQYLSFYLTHKNIFKFNMAKMKLETDMK